MHPTTAILLFSRSAAAEAALKFGRYGSRGHTIAHGLITRTRQTLERSGLPVFRCDERQQSGMSFGERVTHSIQGVFARGFEHVIVVGNDCPELTASHLRSAAQILRTGQNVIGRDGRGGIYLLGISRTDFDGKALQTARWQTPFLAEDLSNILRGAQEITPLRDLNRLKDLRANWHRWKHFLGRLSNALEVLRPGENTGLQFTASSTHRLDTGRAPPVAA